jgi:hypothetical protein
LSGSGEESEAAELLAAYRPDYFVSGHDHAFPYTSGQSWNQRLGETRLLVPGQLLRAPFPNYISLDTESGENSWHTTSEASIQADGLHDHLFVEVGEKSERSCCFRSQRYLPKGGMLNTAPGKSAVIKILMILH